MALFSWSPDENWAGYFFITASVASTLSNQQDSVDIPILVTRLLPHRSIQLDADGKIALELLTIRPGSFPMGDRNGDWIEKPVHNVTITKEFEIGKYEVTQEQWTAVMGNNPSRQGPQNPVENVSWNGCQEFCRKLTEKFADKDKKRKILPAHRGAVGICLPAEGTRSYCFGDEVEKLDYFAWHRKNAGNPPAHPVGEKLPNIWGLYDMHGGVREWCADWFPNLDYQGASQEDPFVMPNHSSGSIATFNGAEVLMTRPEMPHSNRDYDDADNATSSTGFRVVCIRGYLPSDDAELRLANIGRKSISGGRPLSFQVSVENAQDWNGNLRFSLLDNGIPSNRARIDPVTGVFTWQPEEFRAGQTAAFTVFVSDSAGIQSDQQSFNVFVEKSKNRSPSPEDRCPEDDQARRPRSCFNKVRCTHPCK